MKSSQRDRDVFFNNSDIWTDVKDFITEEISDLHLLLEQANPTDVVQVSGTQTAIRVKRAFLELPGILEEAEEAEQALKQLEKQQEEDNGSTD